VHPIVALLRWPLGLIPAQTHMRVLLGPLRGARWVVGSGNHVAWIGLYEFRKQQTFVRSVKRRSVVFDIGAHAGFYSLLASRLVGPHGVVFALEPLPANVSALREHLRINQIGNVRVLELAAWDRTGRVSFDDMAGSTYTGRIATTGRRRVQAIRLDELVDSGTLPPPDVIKMDIEGAELEALRGAHAVLSRYKPEILLATHGSVIHRECLTLLSSLGYSVAPLRGHDLLRTDELIARHPARPRTRSGCPDKR
jgi:FkbM family methyltransferase